MTTTVIGLPRIMSDRRTGTISDRLFELFRTSLWCKTFVTTLTLTIRELERKLGPEHLDKAYNYLKQARFDDRRPGAEINEKLILHDLSKMVPDADDRFKVEQLLFLEMQIHS